MKNLILNDMYKLIEVILCILSADVGFDLVPKVEENGRVSPGLCSVVSEDSSGKTAIFF